MPKAAKQDRFCMISSPFERHALLAVDGNWAAVKQVHAHHMQWACMDCRHSSSCDVHLFGTQAHAASVDVKIADAAAGCLLQLGSLEGKEDAKAAAACGTVTDANFGRHKYEVFLSHKVCGGILLVTLFIDRCLQRMGDQAISLLLLVADRHAMYTAFKSWPRLLRRHCSGTQL